MTVQHKPWLDALGVQTYAERRAPAASPPAVRSGLVETAAAAPTREGIAAASADVRTLDWQQLRERVADCRLCELCESRQQTVFGTGDMQADWMIVGEAPGAEEDKRGEPFVGRAGQLLDAMLAATGHPRPQVYIANILKCRPPGNRDPKPAEARRCTPYLDRQIALLKPRLIIAVGRVAAQRLLGTDATLGKLRGRVHYYGDAPRVPVVVTYHPAYLLRSPAQKRSAWEDLMFAHKVAGGQVH